MINEIPDMNTFVYDMLSTRPKIIGYGCFAYGVYEYWSTLANMINLILSHTSSINIFIDENPTKINKLNNIINTKNPKIKLSRNYDYNNGPLQNFVDLKYDNLEFLNFINTLNNYNINNNQINIYGVYKDDNNAKPEKEIYKYITDIYNRNPKLSIFIGHTTLIQKVKLSQYKSVGYYLNKTFNKSYIAITTAAKQGLIKFTGDKIHNIPLFSRPLPLQFTDRGSLQRYVKNNINLDNNIIILKVSSEMGYSFYYTGESRDPFTKKQNYLLIDDFDYVIYIVMSTIVHDIYM